MYHPACNKKYNNMRKQEVIIRNQKENMEKSQYLGQKHNWFIFSQQRAVGSNIWEESSQVRWERQRMFTGWSYHQVLFFPSSPKSCFTKCIHSLIQLLRSLHLTVTHTGALVLLWFLASGFLFRVESQRERARLKDSSVFQNCYR